MNNFSQLSIVKAKAELELRKRKNKDFKSIDFKKLCEEDFYFFVKNSWAIIDAAAYQDTWHIECLCKHLQAVFEFKIPILDITIPPGLAKSLITSVLYPVWCWIKEPSLRFLTGSHEISLAIRDTLKSRYLIQSSWFQNLWADKFVLTSDQNTKGNYLNDKKGYRVATSSGSGTTGYRADIIIFDDAMSRAQADSTAERLRINDYLRQTLYNRQDIISKTRIIIIGQRLHPDDYHTIFLNLKGCLHINLPLEFEPENAFKSNFYTDPRITKDEILWKIPKFFGEELERLKMMMGKRGYETQYQQRTSVSEGEILKRSDWKYYEQSELPTYLKIVSGWDFAAKAEHRNDFTACLTIGKSGNKFYILDLYRKKVEFPQAKRDFLAHVEKYNPAIIYIEDTSNGTPLISELRDSNFKYKNRIRPISTKGKDKLSRVIPITPIIEAGNVFLPKNADWLDIFIDECSNFPSARSDNHDDIVDALSMILNEERQILIPEIAIINFK